MVFEQEMYVGDSELSLVDAPTSTPNVLTSKQDGVRGSSEGGLCGRISIGGTIAGEDAGAPVLMGVAGTNVSPRTDGNRMNRVEPRPKDAPGQATLTPRTLKGSGFSPSSEAALYDVMSVPGSFGIVDLGTREPGLLTYTRAPLLPAS
jgi:hypothetical protein